MVSSAAPKLATRTVTCRGTAFKVVAGGRDAFWDSVDAGRWEPATFQALDRHLTPRTILLDVGAWNGPVSLYAARRGARVISVEADPLAVADLRANVAANPDLAERITVVAKAIYPSGGRVTFGSRGEGNDSTSSFVHRRMKTRWTVETITPAALAAMVPLLSGSLIVKMDIEGGEYMVAPAARALWSRPDVAAALISLHPSFIEPDRLRRPLRMAALTGRIFAAFAGYRIERLSRSGLIPRPDAAVLGRLGLVGIHRDTSWLFSR